MTCMVSNERQLKYLAEQWSEIGFHRIPECQ